MISYYVIAIAMFLYFPFETFVFRPLMMKLFPKYWILHYLGVAAFDLKQIGKRLVKLKESDIDTYNKVLKKASELYKFSIDEKELDKQG